MTGLIASIVEAYGELRVNKGRILLSLVGVAFSVFALTAVMGGGGMLTSALTQSTETWAGRDTTLTIYPAGSAAEVTPEEQDAVVLEQIERLGIDQRTRRINDSLRVQTPHGVKSAQLTGVDPAYGNIYRTTVADGRWLADSDARRLAPALVVNAPMYEQLGRPDLGTEPVTIYGPTGATDSDQAIVVGVLPAAEETDWGLQAYVAMRQHERAARPDRSPGGLRLHPVGAAGAGRRDPRAPGRLAAEHRGGILRGPSELDVRRGSGLPVSRLCGHRRGAGDPGARRPGPGEHLPGHGALPGAGDRDPTLLRRHRRPDLRGRADGVGGRHGAHAARWG